MPFRITRNNARMLSIILLILGTCLALYLLFAP